VSVCGEILVGDNATSDASRDVHIRRIVRLSVGSLIHVRRILTIALRIVWRRGLVC